LLQLARGSVRVLFMGRRGKEAVLYDSASVEARFGLPPERLPAYIALVGDPSDNLPAVPGVGPGTAAKLLRNVENAAALLADLGAVRPERLREALEQHREQILLSERLAALRDDVELGAGVRHAVPSTESLLRLREWFDALEMKSLLLRVDALL
jgi:DNA polymerase-1